MEAARRAREPLMALRSVTGVGVGLLILFGQAWDTSVVRAQAPADIVPRQSEKEQGLSAQPLAEAGDANAQWMVGQGLLSPPDADPAAAFKWFLRAADQGHGLVQRDLGLLYEAGWGVEQSLQEAYFWYSLAALRRDALATGLSHEQLDTAERRLRLWRPRKESSTAN